MVGDAVCCLAIAAVCLAVGLPRYQNGIQLGDEGFLAHGAVRVLEGQVPNRDFTSLQPPLSFYTVAMAFELLGTSLTSLRTLGLCLYLLIALLIYLVSRCLTGRIMALAAALPATILGMPYFDFVPFAVWHGVAATLAAVWLVLRAAATGRRRWGFLAGVTTALALLSRHDQGVYLSIAILGYALILKLARTDTAEEARPSRLLAWWMAGVATLLAPVALYWAACGAAPQVFDQLVVFPLTTYSKTSSLPMPGLGSGQSLQARILAGLFYLPPVAEGLTLIWLSAVAVFRRFGRHHARVGFVLALSILFYCQALTRSDLDHLLITLAPFFVLCGWWLGRAAEALSAAVRPPGRRDRGNRVTSISGATAVLLAVAAFGGWFLSVTKPVFLRSPAQPTRAISLDRAGVTVESKLASGLERAVGLIQRHAEPDRSILILPYQPMLYFLSERRNPTRWSYLWPGDQTPEDHRALIEQARTDPPAVVAIFDRREMRRYASSIVAYVESEYAMASELGPLTIYLPR